MHETLKRLLLRVLRVPAEPQAPAGSPGSVRVFRAGRNYYRYHAALWALRQAAAFLGVFIVVGIPKPWDGLSPPPRLTEVVQQFKQSLTNFSELKERGERRAPRGEGSRREEFDGDKLLEPMWRVMGALFPVIESLGVAFLLVQMPFTFMMVRLDYEMRWYVITDRSLRIREGLRQVRETTLSFANIQNVSIEQGPIERLLGLSNLKVRSAGGGSGSGSEGHAQEHGRDHSLHVAYFRGVDNPEAIRDAILGHLRRLRDAGLGDPDERAPAPEALRAVAAAQALLEEVRALRRAV